MALKLWLPLNGTLKNKGASGDIAYAIASGNSFTSGGKISSNALKLTKIQQILSTTSCMTGAKEVSYAFWVKVNTAWSADWLDGIRWISTNGASTATERQEFYTNCTLIGTWYKGGAIYGKAFTPGVWTHLAATINYNTGEACFYVNGDLKGTTSNVDTTYYCRGDFYIGDNGVDILQNDVRIYDHCLSQKEIKEISQGLVLHYKLDGLSQGSGNNLVTGLTKGGQTTVVGNTIVTSGQNSDTYFKINLSSVLTLNKSYTMGIDAENLPEGGYFRFPIGSQSNSSAGYINIYNGHNESVFIANDVIVNCGTSLMMDDINRTAWPNQCIFKNFYIYENTSVADSSGYGNDGTVQGSLSTINNSARYEISTIFTGSYVDYIYRPILDYIKKPFTISCWACPKAYPSYRAIMISNGGKDSVSHGIDLYINSSGIPCFMIANNNTAYYASSPNALSLNTWYLLTCTYNGTSMELYVNGELKKTTNATIEPDYDTTPIAFVIGKMGHSYTNTGGYFAFNGYINDVRVYATALSAEDVLNLYNTPTWIDKNNSWHTHEFYETAQGRELMGGEPFTNGYGNHNYLTAPFTNYNEKGEMVFTGGSHVGSNYIKINPTGHTYYYDIEISVDANNQFYLGFHRYDANKTARENNACVYVINVKPTTALNHQRYFGTVNLATDGVNPTDTISLRILNDWTNANSRHATIHYLSLREVDGTINANPEITKNGLIKTDTFRQWDDNEAKIYKNGFIGGNNLIEI